MTELKLVQQPTGDTCTSACLAMLAGIPIDTVISEFHQEWKSSAATTNPQTYLLQKGFECEVRADTFNNCVDWDGVYLVTVASLNIPGGLHHIILDMRNGIETVLDPNIGRHDKKYYIGWSAKPENELEIPLRSWIVDLEIKYADSIRKGE